MNERVKEPKGLRLNVPFSKFFRGLIGRTIVEQVKAPEPEWLRLTLPSSHFDVRVDEHDGNPANIETRAWVILAKHVMDHGLSAYGVDPNADPAERKAEPLLKELRALYNKIDAGVKAPAAVRSANFHKLPQDIDVSEEPSAEFVGDNPLTHMTTNNRAIGVIVITSWERHDAEQAVREFTDNELQPEHV